MSEIDDDTKIVVVCAACLTACCWQGKFYCNEYKTAGTKKMTVKELRALNREHEGYWR